MTRRYPSIPPRLPSLFLIALAFGSPAIAQSTVEPKGITPFTFETLASRSASFDHASYVYPAENDLAGQINPNAGDVRLDGILIDGSLVLPSSLQLVTAAKVVQDDAVDAERGGGNLTAGYGIGADLDQLIGEGVGSTTPAAEDIALNQGNLNLTSITPVRENVGTAIYEVSFATPTDTLLLWERGNSGDVLVELIGDDGATLGALLVLDGANDGTSASTYAKTGIIVTTFVQDGFLNQGQELSAVGLKLDQAAKTFRFTIVQEAEGDGAVRYNGPDLKIIALAETTT